MAKAFVSPTFITLGPEGTDHERVTQRYVEFQGLLSVARIELMGNEALVADGPDRVLHEPNSFLVQCSAHPEVHTVTERYPQDVVIVDSFIDATRNLSLLVRKDVSRPKKLGLVKATRGYTDLDKWEEIVDVQAKPVLSEKLLEGEFDAGITFTDLAGEHPDVFRVEENYGEVVTTWIVYGHERHGRYAGQLIGHRIPSLFTEGIDA